MWYLVFYPYSSLRISSGVVYMAFGDYEQAVVYATTHGIDGVITDDLSPFI